MDARRPVSVVRAKEMHLTSLSHLRIHQAVFIYYSSLAL